MKLSFEEKISYLKQVIKNIKLELEGQQKSRDEITPYIEVFREHRNVTKLNRAILLDLVEEIHVREDKSIEIDFRFEDTYQKLLIQLKNNE
ncbi:hypothetical protein IGJ00_002434 [Enterococcus sp. AZ062]